jgi:DNA helicase-2/ATP-dependent DNA helicase PcrA
VKFYERAEVRDVLAYCKALANPADDLSVKRIINTPRRGIGKSTIDQVEQWAVEHGTSMMDALRESGAGLGAAAAARCRTFLELFNGLKVIAESEVAPHVIEAVLKSTDYMKYLQENYPDAEARVENVEELLSAAHSFAEGAEDKSLRAFLEEVALVADVDTMDFEAGQLTLMTLHNAKGLEFNTVIITGLEEGLFPHYNSIDDPAAVEEERRLFYVGMTRARKHLFLTFAGMRRRMGLLEGGVPSRFLNEIPEKCLDVPVEAVYQPTRSVFPQRSTSSRWTGGRPFVDEYAQAEAPDDSYSQDVPAFTAGKTTGYAVGTRIVHDRFGKGIVRRVEGSGDQTRVTVIFDAGGERKFLVHYAPMRPL